MKPKIKRRWLRKNARKLSRMKLDSTLNGATRFGRQWARCLSASGDIRFKRF